MCSNSDYVSESKRKTDIERESVCVSGGLLCMHILRVCVRVYVHLCFFAHRVWIVEKITWGQTISQLHVCCTPTHVRRCFGVRKNNSNPVIKTLHARWHCVVSNQQSYSTPGLVITSMVIVCRQVDRLDTQPLTSCLGQVSLLPSAGLWNDCQFSGSVVTSGNDEYSTIAGSLGLSVAQTDCFGAKVDVCAKFMKWTTVAVPWWQHHKHHCGYYWTLLLLYMSVRIRLCVDWRQCWSWVQYGSDLRQWFVGHYSRRCCRHPCSQLPLYPARPRQSQLITDHLHSCLVILIMMMIWRQQPADFYQQSWVTQKITIEFGWISAEYFSDVDFLGNWLCSDIL